MRKGEHLVQFCASQAQKESAIADLVACAGEREKVVLFSDSAKLSSAVSKRVGKTSKNGARLSCLPAKGVIFPADDFEATEVLDSVRKTIESQRESGQTSMTVVIDMAWLQERPEWFRSFMQVEVSLNLTKFRFPVTLVCQYDIASLSAEEVETVNSVHAISMVEGKVSRNFWLIPRRGGTFEDMGLVPEESQ